MDSPLKQPYPYGFIIGCLSTVEIVKRMCSLVRDPPPKINYLLTFKAGGKDKFVREEFERICGTGSEEAERKTRGFSKSFRDYRERQTKEFAGIYVVHETTTEDAKLKREFDSLVDGFRTKTGRPFLFAVKNRVPMFPDGHGVVLVPYQNTALYAGLISGLYDDKVRENAVKYKGKIRAD